MAIDNISISIMEETIFFLIPIADISKTNEESKSPAFLTFFLGFNLSPVITKKEEIKKTPKTTSTLYVIIIKALSLEIIIPKTKDNKAPIMIPVNIGNARITNALNHNEIFLIPKD